MNIAEDMEDWREDEDPPAPLPFDRRRNDRWPTDGSARAVLLDSENFGQMKQLALLDYSTGGLGAICSSPINPGTTVSIGYNSPGAGIQRGTVVRCLPCGNGYRVAIRFECRLAA